MGFAILLTCLYNTCAFAVFGGALQLNFCLFLWWPELAKPVFETYSPPELLDRHLQMGGDIHAKQLSKIPLTNQDSINWTHFGGIKY